MVWIVSLRHDCSGYLSSLLYWFVRMDVFLFSPNMHWISIQFYHTYVLNITILPLQKIYFALCLVSLYFYKILESILRTSFLIYVTLCINFYLFRLDNFGPFNLNTFIILKHTQNSLFSLSLLGIQCLGASWNLGNILPFPCDIYLLHFLGLYGILS
jgi:hypothetical protein